MLSDTTGIVLVMMVLGVFAAIGVKAAQRFGVTTVDGYVTARGTQTGGALALNFFASALGAWILFSPPEVGTFSGLLGIGGYALGQAAAIAVFGLVGPRVRREMPDGSTILQFVGARFGVVQQTYVAAVSLLYMFVFLAAELTAIGGVVGLLSGTDRLVSIIAVAVATAAYTAYGGLPASIATDRWQGWLILALGLVAVIALGTDLDDPMGQADAGGLWTIGRTGAETAVVLVIAIVAANLFHQGFWQRVWASKDDRELRRGALGGGLLILPVIFGLGVAGAIGGQIDPDHPSLAFFSLLAGQSEIILAAVLVLAVALVASSVDTLQNALTSLSAVHARGPLRSLSGARLVTVVLTIPAVAIASADFSVLRLFLIADLLAATIAGPVFLGLWVKVTPQACLWGSVSGIVGVVAVGWANDGSLYEGVRLLTLPNGPALGAFVGAVVASGVVTLLISLVTKPTTLTQSPPR